MSENIHKSKRSKSRTPKSNNKSVKQVSKLSNHAHINQIDQSDQDTMKPNSVYSNNNPNNNIPKFSEIGNNNSDLSDMGSSPKNFPSNNHIQNETKTPTNEVQSKKSDISKRPGNQTTPNKEKE